MNDRESMNKSNVYNGIYIYIIKPNPVKTWGIYDLYIYHYYNI